MLSVTQRNVSRKRYVYTPGGTEEKNKKPLSRQAVHDGDSNQANSEYKPEQSPLEITRSVKLSYFLIYILKEANFHQRLLLDSSKFLNFMAGDICFCYRFIILKTHVNGDSDTQKRAPYTQWTGGLSYWANAVTVADLKHKRSGSFCKISSII